MLNGWLQNAFNSAFHCTALCAQQTGFVSLGLLPTELLHTSMWSCEHCPPLTLCLLAIGGLQLGVTGILVLDAREGGPAWKAGIQGTKRDDYGRLVYGDIITAFNGAKIKCGTLPPHPTNPLQLFS